MKLLHALNVQPPLYMHVTSLDYLPLPLHYSTLVQSRVRWVPD